MKKDTLGDRVKKLRIDLGWSQDELSKRHVVYLIIHQSVTDDII